MQIVQVTWRQACNTHVEIGHALTILAGQTDPRFAASPETDFRIGPLHPDRKIDGWAKNTSHRCTASTSYMIKTNKIHFVSVIAIPIARKLVSDFTVSSIIYFTWY